MPHRSAVLLGLLMVTALLVVGQLYVTISMTDRIAREFAVAASRASWSGSAFGFAYATGFLIMGPLSDRIGRRAVLIAGLLMLALATGALGFAKGMNAFLLGRAVQGLAASAFPPAALALVTEALPPVRRNLGVSLLSFAFLAAAPVSQIVGSAADLPAPLFMLTVAPLYALCALGLWRVVPDQSETARPQATAALPFRANGRVLAGWGAALTVLFAFVGFQIGASRLAAAGMIDGQLVRIAGLPPLLLTIAAAPLSSRFGSLTTARVGLMLLVAGCILGAAGPRFLPLASIGVAAGVALSVPGLIATIAAAAEPAHRGLSLAIYTFCLFVGASVAPPVGAVLSDTAWANGFFAPVLPILAALIGLTVARSPSGSSPRTT